MVRWAAAEAEVWRKASHPQANARMFKAHQCTVHHGNRIKGRAMGTTPENEEPEWKVPLYDEGWRFPDGLSFTCR